MKPTSWITYARPFAKVRREVSEASVSRASREVIVGVHMGGVFAATQGWREFRDTLLPSLLPPSCDTCASYSTQHGEGGWCSKHNTHCTYARSERGSCLPCGHGWKERT